MKDLCQQVLKPFKVIHHQHCFKAMPWNFENIYKAVQNGITDEDSIDNRGAAAAVYRIQVHHLFGIAITVCVTYGGPWYSDHSGYDRHLLLIPIHSYLNTVASPEFHRKVCTNLLLQRQYWCNFNMINFIDSRHFPYCNNAATFRSQYYIDQNIE